MIKPEIYSLQGMRQAISLWWQPIKLSGVVVLGEDGSP
jgi:hypothetical protein